MNIKNVLSAFGLLYLIVSILIGSHKKNTPSFNNFTNHDRQTLTNVDGVVFTVSSL